ncbi:MAG: pyridoxine 5'-phosphate synthase [Leptonema sp. (in: bacteria)]
MRSLSVNLDHIATLREVRKLNYPSVFTAASICEISGADGITVHLRGDRRHIQDKDLYILREISLLPLTLEMAPTEEMLKIALKVRPHKVTLVPERRMEITTEGGLDLRENQKNLKEIIEQLKKEEIQICLFLEPDLESIQMAKEFHADAVEIHTGRFAILFNQNKQKGYLEELDRIKESILLGHSLKLNMNVGHGLHYQNVSLLAKIPEIQEFSIGHSIVSRAIFVGLEKAIREMLDLIKI